MRSLGGRTSKLTLMLFLAPMLLGGACSGSEPRLVESQPSPTPALRTDVSPLAPDGAITPVYVTLAGHLENDRRYTDCASYPVYRQQLLDFAELIAGTGATFNLQIEYEFFLGVQNCETAAMQASTDGRNVVDYLAAHYAFEIDAHQEGGTDAGPDNYADVHYLGSLATSQISDNVGGMLWDVPAQFNILQDGMPGWLHPEHRWTPEILTLAVSRTHHEGDFSQDDQTSGVWIPRRAGTEFLAHDPGGRMVYVGPGVQHSNWSGRGECDFANVADYVEVLVEYLQRGALEGDRIYTASLPIPQSVIFSPVDHHKVTAQLEQLAPLVASGHVVYATYAQVVDIWRTQYGSQANILPYGEIDPADYTCP